MEIKVDRRIYSDSCISKAVYALASKYAIERVIVSDEIESLNLSGAESDLVKTEIINCLNDYKLRCIIEAETHDIRTLLYAKAFSECDNVDIADMD